MLIFERYSETRLRYSTPHQFGIGVAVLSLTAVLFAGLLGLGLPNINQVVLSLTSKLADSSTMVFIGAGVVGFLGLFVAFKAATVG